jgi:HSP20 family molecular chaperone IbpA
MMTKFYLHPYDPFTTIRQHPARRYGQPPQTRPNSSLESAVMRKIHTPAIEFQITKDAFILRAEVPGIDGKDLDVQVSRQLVTISGNYQPEKTENQGRIRTEFRYGQLYRQIELPEPVVVDQLQATLKNGILTLTLPKVSATRPKVTKVSVKAETTPAQNPVPVEQMPTQLEPEEISEVTINDEQPQKSTSLVIESELSEDVWESNSAA